MKKPPKNRKEIVEEVRKILSNSENSTQESTTVVELGSKKKKPASLTNSMAGGPSKEKDEFEGLEGDALIQAIAKKYPPPVFNPED
jgi:hypothetical protein